MRSVLAPLFVYYCYPFKFWGTCCPLRGWSSGLDCPTITDFYRFPLMLLDPLPKAGLPPLTAGILSLCFLGSLLTYYCCHHRYCYSHSYCLLWSWVQSFMPFRLRSAVFPAAICRPSGFTAVCETDFRCPLTSPSGASGNRLLLLRVSVSQFSSLMVGLFMYVLSARCPQWWGYNSYTWLFCEVVHYTSNINYDMRIQQWEYLYIL